jgi:hypothetical protein
MPAAQNLHELLEQISAVAGERERIALGDIVRQLGRRSFAPLLLLAGLIAFSPLSGIPGVPTLVAVMVGLTAVQLLWHRDSFWLPGWLMRRSISQPHFEKALRFVRRPALWLDRWLHPRWTALTGRAATRVVAAICLLVAATMPVMELVPFAATTTGAAITAFAIALITRDGVVELVAVLITVATLGGAFYAVAATTGA